MKALREISFGYREFQRDPIRIRMDNVLAFYWQKNMDRFHKWRIKYLKYVQVKYPHIYQEATKR